MTSLDRFGDRAWDNFFEFLYPHEELCTADQAKAELERLGIDIRQAVQKVLFAVEAARAQAALAKAKASRPTLLDRLGQTVIPPVKELRANLQMLIERKLAGSRQAAYFRKLENAASDDDLRSLYEDIQLLDALPSENDDQFPAQ